VLFERQLGWHGIGFPLQLHPEIIGRDAARRHITHWRQPIEAQITV
jgi:hypothetical protein